MSSTDRLRRYVVDECGSCTDDDLSERIAELEALNEAIGGSEMNDDVELLSAPANEKRYKVVRMLPPTDDDELCRREPVPLSRVRASSSRHGSVSRSV